MSSPPMRNHLLQQVRSLFEQTSYDNAIELLDKFLVSHPNDVEVRNLKCEAHFYKAEGYFNENNPDLSNYAQILLEAHMATDSSDPYIKSEAFYLLGNAYAHYKKYEEGINSYEKALENCLADFTSDPEKKNQLKNMVLNSLGSIYIARAENYEVSGENGNAIADYIKAKDIDCQLIDIFANATEPEEKRKLADLQNSFGRLSFIIANHYAVIIDQNYDPVVLYTQSISAYQLAIKLGEPADANMYSGMLERGKLHLSRGEYLLAFEDFKSYSDSCLKKSSNPSMSYEEVITQLGNYIDSQPQNAETKKLKAKLYKSLAQFSSKKNNYNKALEHWTVVIENSAAALRLNPEDAEAKRILANAFNGRSLTYFALRQFNEAIEDGEKSASYYLNSEDLATVYDHIGNCYLYKGQFSEALSTYNHSRALLPNLDRLIIVASMRPARMKLAKFCLKRAGKYNLENEQVLSNADCWQAVIHSTLVIKSYEALPGPLDYDTASNMGDTYLIRGLAYFNLGELDQAIDDLKKAAESPDPSNKLQALNVLSDAYEQKQEYELKAKLHCKLARDYQQKEDYLEALKHSTIALESYKAAGSLTSNNLEMRAEIAIAFYERGATYFDLRQPDKAIEDFEKSASYSADPERQALAINYQGDCYLEKKQFSEALLAFEHARVLFPKLAFFIRDGNVRCGRMQLANFCLARAREHTLKNKQVLANADYREVVIHSTLAIESYENLAKYEPNALNQTTLSNMIGTYITRGLAYLNLEKLNEAIHDLKKGVKSTILSDKLEALGLLAKAYGKLGEYNLRDEMLLQAKNLNQKSAQKDARFFQPAAAAVPTKQQASLNPINSPQVLTPHSRKASP